MGWGAVLNLVKFEMAVSYSDGKTKSAVSLLNLCDSSKEMSGLQETWDLSAYRNAKC